MHRAWNSKRDWKTKNVHWNMIIQTTWLLSILYKFRPIENNLYNNRVCQHGAIIEKWYAKFNSGLKSKQIVFWLILSLADVWFFSVSFFLSLATFQRASRKKLEKVVIASLEVMGYVTSPMVANSRLLFSSSLIFDVTFVT